MEQSPHFIDIYTFDEMKEQIAVHKPGQYLRVHVLQSEVQKRKSQTLGKILFPLVDEPVKMNGTLLFAFDNFFDDSLHLNPDVQHFYCKIIDEFPWLILYATRDLDGEHNELHRFIDMLGGDRSGIRKLADNAVQIFGDFAACMYPAMQPLHELFGRKKHRHFDWSPIGKDIRDKVNAYLSTKPGSQF